MPEQPQEQRLCPRQLEGAAGWARALRFVLRVAAALPRGRTTNLLKTDHVALRRLLAEPHDGYLFPRRNADGTLPDEEWPPVDEAYDCLWDEFPLAVKDAVLAAYAGGEMDLLAAVTIVTRCSRIFWFHDLLLRMFWRDRTLTPSSWNGRRPTFPSWFKDLAVTLVRILDEENPGQLAPGHYTAWTSPTLNASVDWLVTLGLLDNETLITQKTLYGWFGAEGYVAASRRPS